MKILVAEDDRVSRRLLESRLRKWGYEVTAAADGAEAWKIFQEEQFSMVISDWMMPKIDGIELLQRIRSAKNRGYVYTIILTARSDKEDILKAMNSGADDFITKPFDKDELSARLKVGLRITSLEQNLAQRNHELKKINNRMRRDLESAARIQRSFLPTKLPECEKVEFAWKYIPCNELAGDTLNVFFLDDEHIGLYLLDVSGHGVPAALLSVTLSRDLNPDLDQSDLLKEPISEPPGYRIISPEDVAERLNQRFPLDLNSGQYFTIQYGQLNIKSGIFKFFSAGHPPMIHIRNDGSSEVLLIRSTPIGFITDTHKVYQEHSLRLAAGDRLYLYSDGIIEALNPEQDQFGVKRLRGCLSKSLTLPLADTLDKLKDEIDQWTDGSGCGDDLSLLALEIKP